MASMKYDLPMLDYKTRFSLWQVKMRAILAQTNDLDEALEKFGKKKKDEWTDERSARTVRLFLLFSFIYLMIFCKKCCRKRLLQNRG